MQGGFQVDGAATAENSYLIEGQETGSLVTGKQTTSAPFEFIQEVQLKTSGIDAENGGAMGGVINAIQKKGSNSWHGSIFAYYEADPMDAAEPLAQATERAPWPILRIPFAMIPTAVTPPPSARTTPPSSMCPSKITTVRFNPGSKPAVIS